jgi:hypothetical protein
MKEEERHNTLMFSSYRRFLESAWCEGLLIIRLAKGPDLMRSVHPHTSKEPYSTNCASIYLHLPVARAQECFEILDGL